MGNLSNRDCQHLAQLAARIWGGGTPMAAPLAWVELSEGERITLEATEAALLALAKSEQKFAPGWGEVFRLARRMTPRRQPTEPGQFAPPWARGARFTNGMVLPIDLIQDLDGQWILDAGPHHVAFRFGPAVPDRFVLVIEQGQSVAEWLADAPPPTIPERCWLARATAYREVKNGK